MTSIPPGTSTISIPFKLKKRGGRKIVIAPDDAPTFIKPIRRDSVMIKTVARGFRWRSLLDSGKFNTLEDLANREKISPSYVSRVVKLTLLSPEIIEAILNGTQPALLDTKSLLKPFPSEWRLQKRHFGFDTSFDWRT